MASGKVLTSTFVTYCFAPGASIRETFRRYTADIVPVPVPVPVGSSSRRIDPLGENENRNCRNPLLDINYLSVTANLLIRGLDCDAYAGSFSCGSESVIERCKRRPGAQCNVERNGVRHADTIRVSHSRQRGDVCGPQRYQLDTDADERRKGGILSLHAGRVDKSLGDGQDTRAEAFCESALEEIDRRRVMYVGRV
jgi:hypothetical protein